MGQVHTCRLLNCEQSRQSGSVQTLPRIPKHMCMYCGNAEHQIPRGPGKKKKAIVIYSVHCIFQIRMSHLILLHLRKVIVAPARNMTSKEHNSLPQELIFISYSKFKIIFFCSKEGSSILLNKVTNNEEQCSKKKLKQQQQQQQKTIVKSPRRRRYIHFLTYKCYHS